MKYILKISPVLWRDKTEIHTEDLTGTVERKE